MGVKVRIGLVVKYPSDSWYVTGRWRGWIRAKRAVLREEAEGAR
jgi:hypothetical protein